MKQRTATAVVLLLGLCAIALAATDFSGTWVLDPARSDQPQMGRQGGGGTGGGSRQGGGQRGERTVTLVIKQSGNDLAITQKTTVGGQERPATEQKFTLDGKENKNTIQFPGRGGSEGRTSEMVTKSKWNGATLVIDGSQKMSTPNGDFDIGIKNEYALSEGGKTLTITRTQSRPDGDSTFKQVYTKK
jgi:hypothetical protein